MCHFEECGFMGAVTDDFFVNVNDSSIYCSFVSCTFAKITTNGYTMLLINRAAEGIQHRCCYIEDKTDSYPYSTGNLANSVANSTVCAFCHAVAPSLKSSSKYSSRYNNHSNLIAPSSYSSPSCYYQNVVPNIAGATSYFMGSSCTGKFPVAHSSTTAYCQMSYFNLLNNSNENGYFFLGFSNRRSVKNFFIAFKSTPRNQKWIYHYNAQDALTIIDSYVISPSGSIPSDSIVTTTRVYLTYYTPKYTPFDITPHCSIPEPQSGHFSMSFELYSDSFSKLFLQGIMIFSL